LAISNQPKLKSRPSADTLDWVWDWVAQGPPKRHAWGTQGSIFGSAFVFNKSWKKAGWVVLG
jgi:hypothetical protein